MTALKTPNHMIIDKLDYPLYQQNFTHTVFCESSHSRWRGISTQTHRHLVVLGRPLLSSGDWVFVYRHIHSVL